MGVSVFAAEIHFDQAQKKKKNYLRGWMKISLCLTYMFDNIFTGGSNLYN